MISQVCPCPFCRALIVDDRPPAHHLPDDLPIVAELARVNAMTVSAPLPWQLDGRRRVELS